MRAARRAIVVPLLLAVALVAACASTPPEPTPEPVAAPVAEASTPPTPVERPAPAERSPDPAPTAAPAPRPASPQAGASPQAATPEPNLEEIEGVAPISPKFQRGLEVIWWFVPDSDNATPRVLAPFVERPTPVDDATRDRWAGSGFRVVAVDETEVRAIIETLTPVGRINRDWIGRRRPIWTECFSPPPEARLGPARVQGIDGPVSPHRLRFIARAWTAPDPLNERSLDPILRVDLALQLRDPLPSNSGFSLEDPTLPSVERQGRLFADVAAEIAMRRGQVLVITGEAPGVRWTDPPAPEAARENATPADEFDPAADPDAPADEFGPPVARPATPGEAMLIAESSAIYPAPTRIVVLLIPRVPDELILLPRVEPQ